MIYDKDHNFISFLRNEERFQSAYINKIRPFSFRFDSSADFTEKPVLSTVAIVYNESFI